jgi:hypothetical protein
MMNLRALAQEIIADPLYNKSLMARARAGTLPPDLEELIWSIADLREPLPRLNSAPARPGPMLAFTQSEDDSDEGEDYEQPRTLER